MTNLSIFRSQTIEAFLYNVISVQVLYELHHSVLESVNYDLSLF